MFTVRNINGREWLGNSYRLSFYFLCNWWICLYRLYLSKFISTFLLPFLGFGVENYYNKLLVHPCRGRVIASSKSELCACPPSTLQISQDTSDASGIHSKCSRTVPEENLLMVISWLSQGNKSSCFTLFVSLWVEDYICIRKYYGCLDKCFQRRGKNVCVPQVF